jgi:prolipoprotein diacylglyceryl transferase
LEPFETALFFAIPFGIVGARVYHILTHLGDYFGPGINPWSVFFIWEGGIAIFGAISAGALGAWIGCRRTGVRFTSLADALAPGIALGQAIGRFGNWFNQELYGLPTDLPWGLEIDLAHRVPGYVEYSTFHPTFAYEALWNLFVMAVLLFIDGKFRLGRGKVIAAYVALYGFGRIFTEGIRLDPSYDTFGPIRFNQAVAMLICLAGVVLFAWLAKMKPGREPSVLSMRRIANDSTGMDESETGDRVSQGERLAEESGLDSEDDDSTPPRRLRSDP